MSKFIQKLIISILSFLFLSTTAFAQEIHEGSRTMKVGETLRFEVANSFETATGTWKIKEGDACYISARAPSSKSCEITATKAGKCKLTWKGVINAGFIYEHYWDITVTGDGGGGGNDSKEEYTVTASPAGGKISAGTKVYLTTNIKTAIICYTLDGTDPKTSSSKALVPTRGYIIINETCVLKAYAVGGVSTKVYTWSFTVEKDEFVNKTNFPDDNFRKYLLNIGYKTEEDIKKVKRLDLLRGDIESLKGIEYFTSLTELVCTNNQLTNLDLSKNAALEKLWCGYNQLTSLDLSNNNKLITLNCQNNQLNSLNVSNTSLKSLIFYGNHIKDAAMDALINSLPIVSTYDGVFQLVMLSTDIEMTTGNTCTKSQVATAKSKGWIPCWDNEGKAKYIGQPDPELVPTSISVSPSSKTIKVGDTFTATYTLSPSNATTTVTWTSDDSRIASVDNNGKVKGVKAGTATITCTSKATGAKATCKVTVVDGEVKLSKTKASIEKGKTLTLKATVTPSDLPDKSVTWKSSNTKVATVTSAGKVKGVKAGTATITCTSKVTGAKATCKVTVGYVKLDKIEAVINKGKTVTLKATVYPSTLKDRSVIWKSSNKNVATVTSKGKVKGVKPGTATITCTSNATGLKTTCKVTVGYVKLDQTEVTVKKGKTVTLKAAVYPSSLKDKSVTWESSNTKVATVTSKGKVKGVKYGTATITCTSVATGAKATCQVTVGKVVIGTSEVTIKKSRSVMLYATVYPTDLVDKSVTWKSSDKSIATVDEEGRVKGIKAGTATITCTSNATGLKTTCKVTVTASAGLRSMEGEDNDEVTEIDEVETSAAIKPFDVYDLSGRKVLHQVTSLDGLSDGIYIVNGKKILKKK